MQTAGRSAARAADNNNKPDWTRGDGSPHSPRPHALDPSRFSSRVLRHGAAIPLAMLWAAAAPATTIERVTIDNLIAGAEFVFEGTVTQHEVEGANGRIYTYVHFNIEEVIKGDYSEPTITLRFTGGTMNGYTLSIGGMNMPDVGEHGIYFVESLSKQFTNPLLGWSQGRLPVLTDEDGMERVYNANHQPITGFKRKNKEGSDLDVGRIGQLVLVTGEPGTEGILKSRFIESLQRYMEPVK